MNELTITIKNPYDIDEEVEYLVREAIARVFGPDYHIRRATPKEDYYEGVDFFVVGDAELRAQLKTNYQYADPLHNLDVHLNYTNEEGNTAGFDIYHNKRLHFFLFLWPLVPYALFVRYRVMMDAWQEHEEEWKEEHTTCYRGCYVSLPLYNFIHALGDEGYKGVEL